MDFEKNFKKVKTELNSIEEETEKIGSKSIFESVISYVNALKMSKSKQPINSNKRKIEEIIKEEEKPKKDNNIFKNKQNFGKISNITKN